METILKLEQVSVSYPDFLLYPVDLTVMEGETVAILGESGGGKTTLVHAIAQLQPERAKQSGRAILCGRDFGQMKESERKKLRWETVSICFQNSAQWLNPSMNVMEQFSEILVRRYPRQQHRATAKKLLEQVGLEEADLNRYPRELSGGMLQRVMFALATALEPKLLILDEPTSSLDRGARDEMIRLITELRSRSRVTILIITHDVLLARELCNRSVILYRGQMIEAAATADLLHAAHHPYTKGLLDSLPELHPYRDLWGIRMPDQALPEDYNGCLFYDRCTQRKPECAVSRPQLQEGPAGRWVACHRGGIVKLLDARNIQKCYGNQTVLEDANLKVYAGETVAVVGRSGVGKTTLCSILAGFLPSDGGEIRFDGAPADYGTLHKTKGGIQMVFQDSADAINPYLTVEQVVSEAMRLSQTEPEQRQGKRVREALRAVGLPTDDRFCRKQIETLSGGQRQRVNLARALTMDPALLIADEPTSMLDASNKANVLHMLKELQNQQGCALLIIIHDLESARKIADRIYIVRDGTTHRVSTEQLEELF